jgi:hypothetical protein
MAIDRVCTLGLVMGLLTSGMAFAAGTWDWELEFTSRHWRNATLTWAKNVHPSHPSTTWIQANVAPPAHEMWCHYTGTPTVADCNTYYDKLEVWLQDYLDTDTVPMSAFTSFPKECASACVP